MGKKTWVTTAAALGLSLIVFGAVTSASAPTKANRIRSGWLGTSRAASGSARPSISSVQIEADKTIRTVLVQEGFLLNSIRGGFDEFVVSGPLYNAAETKKVGFGMVRCAVAAPDEGLAECDGTFNLGAAFPGGSQITIQGMSSPATHWFNAITGGTGRFREVDGQVEARNIGTTNKIETTFHLEL